MSNKLIPGVRVVLDLELFFEDKRRKCYHYIDFSRNEVVRDVCNNIRKSFDMKADIFLEVNECYVPANQNARVLYDGDVVRVIDTDRCVIHFQKDKRDRKRCISENAKFLTNTLNDTKIEKLDKQEGNECNENPIVSKPKKRKKSRKADESLEKEYLKDFDESDNPRKKRKSKTKLPDNIATEHEVCPESKKGRNLSALHNISVVLEDFTCKDDTKVEAVSVIKAEERAGGNMGSSTVEFSNELTHQLDPEVESTVSSGFLKTNINGEREDSLLNDRGDTEKSENLDNSSCRKRRRRRHKKPRTNHNCSEQHLSQSSVFTESSFKAPQHIKFEDDEDKEYNNSNNIEFPNDSVNGALDKCISSQYSADNRSFTKNEIKSDSDVPIVNNTAIVRNSDMSENFVIKSSSSPMIFECKRASRLSSNQLVKKESDCEETGFSKYPLVNGAPQVNDIIAFKKLKMTSDYCPSVSHYISAKVLHVSEKDNLIKLKILNGHEEFKEPKGKFSLEEENELEDCEKKIYDIVEIYIADLLDVRLLFP